MKTSKQVQREARYLFRLCMVDGSLDEGRVRQVMQGVLASKRRGGLALANKFERLVRLERQRRTADVESAAPLPNDVRTNVEKSLTRMCGSDLSISFAANPALIGGMRVRVGSDVYDGSVKASLAALERSF